MRLPKVERERLRLIAAWRGQRIEQYAAAYVEGRIEVEEFDRLLADVSEADVDRFDPRFRFVADPHLISYEER